MAELMKFPNGVIFWDVSFFKGVHVEELEAYQVSWIPYMALQ